MLGRRIAKRVYASATGGTVGYTRFVYAGSHVSFDADSAGAPGLRYTWGLASDDLLAVRTAGGQHFYVVQDLIRNVRGLVQRDGTWVLSQQFGPYGALVRRDSSGSGPGFGLRYGWTGREVDAETGWYFFRSRSYDPGSRRFVQEDAIGYAGGMNLYAYGNGDPTNGRDPGGTVMDLEGFNNPTPSPFCFGGSLCNPDGEPMLCIDGACDAWGGGAPLSRTTRRTDLTGWSPLTTSERRAMLTAYYNGLGALDAAARASQQGGQHLSQEQRERSGNFCNLWPDICDNYQMYAILPGHNAITTGVGTAYPRNTDLSSIDKDFVGWLAHELTHVVQSLTNGNYLRDGIFLHTIGHLFGMSYYAPPTLVLNRPLRELQHGATSKHCSRLLSGPVELLSNLTVSPLARASL